MALVPKTVAIDQEESDLYPDFSARAEGTNIDPVTLLATDLP